MAKPDENITMKEAAYSEMAKSYMLASGEDRYYAAARQVMYAGRGDVLRICGLSEPPKGFDKYWTQKWLPDYMAEHPEETRLWKVSYDPRGSFVEPHTGRRIPLGTIAVAQYLGEMPSSAPSVEICQELFPNCRALHRYRHILYIEKKGFDPLFEQTRLESRFDLAIISCEGQSVIAARRLIDTLVGEGHIDNVFTLHDFDIWGFNIFGALSTDSRRYTFRNQIPLVDIGLRLKDVERLGLKEEGTEVNDEEYAARETTLLRHGCTQEEIEFLLIRKQRVELNMMSAPVFIEFLESKLRQYGCDKKVIPHREILEQHARVIAEKDEARKALEDMMPAIRTHVEQMQWPNLYADVEQLLKQMPELSWDMAVSEIVTVTNR